MKNIETKVIAAAAGGGIGTAVGTFLLWLLGVGIWGASAASDQAEHAIAAVPLPVATLLLGLVSLGGAALAGYQAPHTLRPDLAEQVAAGIQEQAVTLPPAVAPTEVIPLHEQIFNNGNTPPPA